MYYSHFIQKKEIFDIWFFLIFMPFFKKKFKEIFFSLSSFKFWINKEHCSRTVFLKYIKNNSSNRDGLVLISLHFTHFCKSKCFIIIMYKKMYKNIQILFYL